MATFYLKIKIPNPLKRGRKKNMSKENPNPGDPGKEKEPVNPEKKDQDGNSPALADLENKLKESSQEAIRLKHENEIMAGKINKLTKNEIPTEQEMRAQYPEWDTYTPTEQRILFDNYGLHRKLDKAQSTIYDLVEERNWEREFYQISNKPGFEGLRGREAEFKRFAYQPRFFVNAGDRKIPVQIETVATAFLYEKPLKKEEPPKPKEEKPGLEIGSGGEKPQGAKKLTPEEIAHIRKSDPKLYRQMLITGKIIDEALE